MAVSKALTTVTPFSKLIAGLLFVLLPFLGFYLGVEYQKSITPQFPPLQYDPSVLSRPPQKMPPQDIPIQVPSEELRTVPPGPPKGETLCTMDARQCPDGTWVGRSGPNCEFVCK